MFDSTTVKAGIMSCTPVTSHPAKRERRERLYFVNSEFILRMCNLAGDPPEYLRVPRLSVPPGAVVQGVHFDPERQAFALRVSHPSFSPVENGDMLPRELGVEDEVLVKVVGTLPAVEVNYDDIKAACQKAADFVGQGFELVRKKLSEEQHSAQVLADGVAEPAGITATDLSAEQMDADVVKVDPPKREQRGYEFL